MTDDIVTDTHDIDRQWDRTHRYNYTTTRAGSIVNRSNTLGYHLDGDQFDHDDIEWTTGVSIELLLEWARLAQMLDVRSGESARVGVVKPDDAEVGMLILDDPAGDGVLALAPRVDVGTIQDGGTLEGGE